jgi:NAD(P)H-dependent FMN reductase
MHFAVIYGSVRTQRKGIRAARWVVRSLRARGHEVTLVDPKEAVLPMLDRMYKEYDEGEAPETMERLARLYRSVDGFVVVSGEYNHGLPPALKNLLDHFQREYFWRPAAILTYSKGHTGGARSQIALRATLPELGMITIPSMLDVPSVGEALTEDGEAVSGHLERAKDRYFEELEWYATALAEARRARGVPYGDPTAPRKGKTP